MADPTFRAATNTAAATRTNTTVVLPTGHAAGDLLLATLCAEDYVTVTLPTGYTLIKSIPSTVAQHFTLYVCGKIDSGSESNPTFTHASTWSQGGMAAYQDVLSSGYVDGTPTSNEGNDLSAVGLSVTTAQTNSILLFWRYAFDDHSGVAPTGSPTFSERIDPSGNIYLADTSGQTLAAGASGNKTSALTLVGGTHNNWLTVMFAITNVSGGGPVTYNLSVSCTQGQAVSLVKQIGLTRAITQAQTCSLVKQIGLIRAVTQGQVVALVKQIGLTRAVTQGQACALLAQRVFLLTVSCVQSQVASLVTSYIPFVGPSVKTGFLRRPTPHDSDPPEWGQL